MILKCKDCDLYKNQKPCFCQPKKSDIIFVGISSQKNKKDIKFEPLDGRTNSGKLIQEIQESLPRICFHKTNLIKCAPLDKNEKIRYPTKKEFENCFENFKEELKIINPKIIFLLGSHTKKFIEQKYNIKLEKEKLISYKNLNFIAINHPSYIMIYKRKELQEYKNKIKELIKKYHNK